MSIADDFDFTKATAWSSQLGDYKLECVWKEEPRDTFTITVEENGKVIDSVVVKQDGPADWMAPHKATEILRARHLPLFIARLRGGR